MYLQIICSFQCNTVDFRQTEQAEKNTNINRSPYGTIPEIKIFNLIKSKRFAYSVLFRDNELYCDTRLSEVNCTYCARE